MKYFTPVLKIRASTLAASFRQNGIKALGIAMRTFFINEVFIKELGFFLSEDRGMEEHSCLSQRLQQE